MKTIRHVGIVVNNLEKTLYFYKDLLGLRIVKKMRESGRCLDSITGLKKVNVLTVKLAADRGVIELLYFYSHKVHKRSRREIFERGLSHIAFTVKDIQKEYDRLLRAGVKFNAPPQVSADRRAKVTFCRDPEGTFIELVEVLI